jgi:hypothetical protein
MATILHSRCFARELGGQSGSIRTALKKQKPVYVAFLHTSLTENVANELKEEFGYDTEHCRKEPVDPLNIDEMCLRAFVVKSLVVRL